MRCRRGGGALRRRRRVRRAVTPVGRRRLRLARPRRFVPRLCRHARLRGRHVGARRLAAAPALWASSGARRAPLRPLGLRLQFTELTEQQVAVSGGVWQLASVRS
eukprot:3997133-Prymnesium_polylepis.1